MTLGKQLQEIEGSDAQFRKQVCFNLDAIMAGNMDTQCANQKRLLAMESKLDDLLQQSDATKRINNELLEAYRASREENTLLKAAIEELTSKIMEQTSTPTPPSPDIAHNPSAREEMSLQLFDVQRDIQDVLEAVCNPAGKRKRAPSTNYDDAETRSFSTHRPTPR
jgi:small-conductance mechanosensitive channel